MKIVVCVKRVALLGDDVEFVDDDRDVDPDYLECALNEWDACAIEEALRLRDGVDGGEVIVVTAGDEEADRELRRCLAMEADRALRVWCEELRLADPIVLARALARAVAPEQPDLVLCGAQSSDAVQGSTGTALAQLLGLPCVAVAKKIEYDHASRRAIVHRELEGGVIDVTEVDTPALLTIQTGINEPRYVTLRAMQAAGARAIELIEPEDLGAPAYGVRRMFLPPTGRAQLIEGSASEVARRIAEILREATG